MLEETRKYMNHLGDYDVIVIGAGHAGIEAAHAAATLGARTAVFTMSLDAIGNMPCNPSIGGTAKGTLVRELDALGGVMGLAADATYLQSRMLNKGKGPAVHALRVQTDRKRYHEYMKHALELTPGLAIHQAEVVSIETENGRVKGVVTQLNGEYSAKCVVIATGTNLGGKIFVGDAWYASGPDGMHAANALTDSLKAAGLPLRRFKTGTPARVHRRSIDFSKLECQPGDPDNELQPFSFMTDAPMHNKVECWIAYTNPETHRIILDNIQRSPLYGGMIEGVGGVHPIRAGRIPRIAHKNFAAEVRAGGQHHALGGVFAVQLGDNALHMAVLHFQRHHLGLMDGQTRGLFQRVLHVFVVAAAVGLHPQCVHGGAFALVQHPALQVGGVCRQTHHAAQRVHLPHQRSLGSAANAGVTGHIADGVQTHGKDGGFCAQHSSCMGGFDARMASANDDDIIFS